MTKFFILVLSLACAPAFSQSRFLTQSLEWQSIASTQRPPESPNPEFGFSKAESYWKNGVLPLPSQLVGDWRLIGTAARPECVYITGENSFSESGKKNSDGSYSLGLAFHDTYSSPDFAGRVERNFVVKISGIGTKDQAQGPYVVRAGAEPQFSIFGYRNGKIVNEYIEMSCRLLQGNSQRMVCGLTPRLQPVDTSEAQCSDQMGLFYGYKQVN